ncbi:hypothetical protein A7W90_00410 [Clostridium sp. Bc-iso-3]|nr:hypothetical protein A7W90_00410 [Clostridium sp. Bc-iso-3]
MSIIWLAGALFSNPTKYLEYESWYVQFGFFAPQKGQGSFINGSFLEENSFIDSKNNSLMDNLLKFSLQNIENNLIIILWVCFSKHISRRKSVKWPSKTDSFSFYIMIIYFWYLAIEQMVF